MTEPESSKEEHGSHVTYACLDCKHRLMAEKSNEQMLWVKILAHKVDALQLLIKEMSNGVTGDVPRPRK
jgi:hypothetical protein